MKFYGVKRKNNYNDFLKRVEDHYIKLERLGVEYGYAKTPIKFNSKFNKNRFDVEIEKGNNNMQIRYKINNDRWENIQNLLEYLIAQK